MQVKHKFVSPKADGADSSVVRPSDWNSDHEITRAVNRVTSNITLTSSHDIIIVDANTGPVTITLPTAVGRSGGYIVKRVDTTTNGVLVVPSGAQTIDGFTAYTLVNKNQYVDIVSDGSNWIVVGSN